jgi:hypothetical protein
VLPANHRGYRRSLPHGDLRGEPDRSNTVRAETFRPPAISSGLPFLDAQQHQRGDSESQILSFNPHTPFPYFITYTFPYFFFSLFIPFNNSLFHHFIISSFPHDWELQ